MMLYKAVFCDIDGTLLDSRHRITSGTKEAVRGLAPLGVPFVLVSARMPRNIVPLQQELGMADPLIAFSGGLVLGKALPDGTRTTLSKKCLAGPIVSELYAAIREGIPDICCTLYSESEWLMAESERNNPWVVQELSITHTEPVLFMPGDLERYADGDIFKVMCMGEPQRIDALHGMLKERFPELSAYRTKGTYLEIMAPGVSKSSAIRVLEKHLGMRQAEALAFGDNFNDVDMLQYAGHGVAMGNAPEEVKAMADEVTGTNDEDGLAQLLVAYFGLASKVE